MADISNLFKLIITYFFLKKKNTLLLLDYYTSAQFDGEEQKAGAIASVFFRSGEISQILLLGKKHVTQHFVFILDLHPI